MKDKTTDTKLEAALINLFRNGGNMNISQTTAQLHTDAALRGYSTPKVKSAMLKLEKDHILKRETTDGITRFSWNKGDVCATCGEHDCSSASCWKKDEKLLKRTVMVIRLCTDNDRNGNPRRLSLVINGNEGPFGRWQAGAIVAALDEGYIGPQVVKDWVKLCMQSYYDLTIVEGPTFNVPVSEYKATLKQHEHAAAKEG